MFDTWRVRKLLASADVRHGYTFIKPETKTIPVLVHIGKYTFDAPKVYPDGMVEYRIRG